MRGSFLPFLLMPSLICGCAFWRSKFGIETPPSSPPPQTANAPAEKKSSASAGILQTGGSDTTGIPLLPLDIPRESIAKTQGPDSSPPPVIPKPAFDPVTDVGQKVGKPIVPSLDAGPPPRVNSTEKLAELAQAATRRYDSIDSYIARFRRREVVAGKQKPEELMLIKFRKNPWSVYFKWLGTEGHNREAVFVPGKYEDKLHTLLAAGDVPLMPAGKRFSLSPDSPLVRNQSRHSIREAGIGSLIDQFAHLVAANAKGDMRFGTLRYIGQIRRPEFDQPCDAVEETIPPGGDPGLPQGGRRLWVFDSVTNLPVLVIAWDESNKEVEYYCYDRIQFPANLTDDDFNPDKIWRPKQGS